MILIGSVVEAPGGVIDIDMYHRGHLSMRTGTEVTMALLPPPIRAGELPPREDLFWMQELVISPIAFESWQYLVRVTALFLDRPGVVRKLAHAMRDMRLNVVYEESATIESGRYHRVEVLAHTLDRLRWEQQHMAESQVQLSDALLLPSMERRLKAICWNDLATSGGRPRLKLRAMDGLRAAHRLVTQRNPFSWVEPVRQRIQSEGRLTLPSVMREHIHAKVPRVILISDTRDRLLRAIMPADGTGFTFVRVRHNDRLGSLHRIADAASRAFTAVVTLTRLRKQSERNDIELLLYAPALPRVEQEAQRRQLIARLFSAPELQELDIRIAYPERPGCRLADDDYLAPESVGGSEVAPAPLAPTEPDLAKQSTVAILRQRIEAYDNADPDVKYRDRERREAAVELMSEEGDAPDKPKVFISYRFGETEHFEAIRAVVEGDQRVAAISGKNPSGPAPYRSVIRDRIRASQGFIGVWPASGPLDWLHWELGVAHAFGIPVVIHPHKQRDVESLRRLMPEYHFEPFEDGTLALHAAEAWAWFRSTVVEEHRKQFSRRHSRAD